MDDTSGSICIVCELVTFTQPQRNWSIKSRISQRGRGMRINQVPFFGGGGHHSVKLSPFVDSHKFKRTSVSATVNVNVREEATHKEAQQASPVKRSQARSTHTHTHIHTHTLKPVTRLPHLLRDPPRSNFYFLTHDSAVLGRFSSFNLLIAVLLLLFPLSV